MNDNDRGPWDEEMSGWRSDFAAASTQLDRQLDRLLGLVGQQVIAGWTGWDPDRERWFDGIPLVLVFDGGTQLELAWDKWDALSVTWHTIDLTVAPKVVGRPHLWRSSVPEAVAAVAGRTVTGFAVVEVPYFSGEDVDFTDGLPMHALAGWMAGGLWIATGDTGLHVYNGWNPLGSVPAVPGYESVGRVTPLATFVAKRDHGGQQAHGA